MSVMSGADSESSCHMRHNDINYIFLFVVESYHRMTDGICIELQSSQLPVTLYQQVQPYKVFRPATTSQSI